MNSFSIHILQPSDKEVLIAWEKSRLGHLDPLERDLTAWQAPWRPEALDHYLPLGWSFAAWYQQDGMPKEPRLAGYFLAQPLVFTRALTQSLWIEHLAADDHRMGLELFAVARRWAKDKNFQSVLFQDLPPELTEAEATSLVGIHEVPVSRWKAARE